MTEETRCPRTGKPIEYCCTGNPWRDNRALNYGEPLPLIVIMLGREHRLDPHAIMDDVEDRGWETHDKGFDDQARIAVDRLRQDRDGIPPQLFKVTRTWYVEAYTPQEAVARASTGGHQSVTAENVNANPFLRERERTAAREEGGE